ncbi:DUF86 domain-containing protein [Pseudokineococcus basanitobsidens]|uniref:DUF86 domain-containing protein n=1 Tax=Pseudokineococcus basanitobsidens TaxID=1926649 RepID=A0ABU8RHN5_9ACTN
MVDAERVRRRLGELDRRLLLLDDLRGTSLPDYRRDVALQAQVERHLQLALQAAIDVALHLVAEEPGRRVEGYGDAFVALAERGVLPGPLAARLRTAAGMRNVLVHGYVDVDPDLVLASLDHLGDLRDLAAAVDRALDA